MSLAARSRRAPCAALVLSLLVPLGACTSGSSTSQGSGGSGGSGSDDPAPTATAAPSESAVPSPADSPSPRAPRAGDCRRLTLAEAAAPTDDDDPVPCGRPHTAVTFAVERLDPVVRGHLLSVDSERVQRQVARTCPPRLASFLGGSLDARRLTRLQTVWFGPTLEAAQAGDDLVRCDLVAFGRDDRLMRLPTVRALRGALDRPQVRARYALCGTARPGDPGFVRVACALPHAWVATSTLDLAGGAAYPGTARLRAAGDETCAERVRADQGLPLEFSYGWEWPTRAQWRAGQRYGLCWAPRG